METVGMGFRRAVGGSDCDDFCFVGPGHGHCLRYRRVSPCLGQRFGAWVIRSVLRAPPSAVRQLSLETWWRRAIRVELLVG